MDLLVKARKARPYWGPVTLRRWLVNRGEDETRLPAPSPIGAILKRHGLVRPRQRRWRTPPSMGTKPSVEADCPNAVWCIDYKGHFRSADGQLCYPLTLIDAYSRFREYGLPVQTGYMTDKVQTETEDMADPPGRRRVAVGLDRGRRTHPSAASPGPGAIGPGP